MGLVVGFEEVGQAECEKSQGGEINGELLLSGRIWRFDEDEACDEEPEKAFNVVEERVPGH